LALKSDETPVGCVFVKDGEIIGRGMNETNRTLNGTRHAEFVAILAFFPRIRSASSARRTYMSRLSHV